MAFGTPVVDHWLECAIISLDLYKNCYISGLLDT